MWDRSVEMHAQQLLDCPSPALLPVLLLLMALELGNVLLKAWTCRADAMSYRRLTARRFEVSKEIKSVSNALVHLGPLPGAFLKSVCILCMQLGIPTDFVRKSKLERELIQVEKDLAPLKGNDDTCVPCPRMSQTWGGTPE